MRPMLASDAKEIRFPVLASPKIDGVRALVTSDNKLVSRSLKPIPNKSVQKYFDDLNQDFWDLDGLDGELVVGPANAPNVMQATTSGVMSREGEPDFTFYVFDVWSIPASSYRHRFNTAAVFISELTASEENSLLDRPIRVKLLEQVRVGNQEELDAFEAKCLDEGYEGVMVRDPNGQYKYGRSTAKDGYLLKVKRFQDAEATVIGFKELMHNANEAKTNALGLTERSTCKANKVGKGCLGALVCRAPDGVEFDIGTGFTQEMRESFWSAQDELEGMLVKYKYLAHGVKEKPRHPVFIGFRDPIDMGGE